MDTRLLFKQVSYWAVNIVFWCCMFLLAFLFIQVLFLSSFKIPTGSMEPTLMVGDYILVNKTVPGARLFNIFASLRDEKTPIYRAPGINVIDRNDVVVFNYPYPHGDDTIRMDIMIYYVKRCIGLPGDSVVIRDGFYHVAGIEQVLGNVQEQERANQIAPFFTAEMKTEIFYPRDSLFHWDSQHFGPLYIPAIGDSLPLTREHISLYHKLISWEQQQPVRVDTEGSVFIGDKRATGYRFTHSYYFVAGDFVQGSLDSRYWGLVPEDYIVGKAWLVWKSFDSDRGRFRHERFLKAIR